ncbi:MAG: FxLYD domain-containing protein [Vicinamibacterales bacterium]
MRSRLLAGLALLAIVTGGRLAVPALAQNPANKPAAALDKQQQQEGNALVQYVQEAMAGNAVPPDVPLSWRAYFVKSQNDQVYVPFTVMLEPGKLSGNQAALYYTVAPKGPRVISVVVKQGDDAEMVTVEGEVINSGAKPAENVKLTVSAMDNNGKTVGTQPAAVPAVGAGQRVPFTVTMKRPRNATQFSANIDGGPAGFRDLSFIDLPEATQGQVRISRAFAVAAGDYDVFVALRERPGKDQKAAPKVAMLTESVSVPDLGGKLTTSSIFIADKIESLSAPLNREAQLKQPYTLGTMAIVPSIGNAVAKTGELSVIFFVYNPGIDAAKKPNIEVEYNFHQKTSEGEKFFNKTNPQQFNAETLPPQFDVAAGHQVVGGQSVPMASFAPGEYRLEVKVSDKVSGQSLTRNIAFTVTG